MAKLLTFPAGRRAKWVVLVAWLLAIAGASAPTCPASSPTPRRTSRPRSCPATPSRPGRCRSTEQLQGCELAPIVVVYRRDGGLTAADRRRIAGDRQELNGLNLRRTSDFGSAAVLAPTAPAPC